ncbi:CBS domain-containing protein [Candidatus Woesearchaeota archaeon]|nr:CBS domain-containing protein [Candidatus Woesearchaeota archaeon]
MHDFIRAEDLMSGTFSIVDSKDTIFNAIKTMNKNNTDFIIVKAGGVPKGIFTEKDIIRIITAKKDLNAPVESAMTTPIISADSGSSLFELFKIMRENNLNKLPVIDGSEVLGIIYNKDLIKGILEINNILKGHLRFEENTTEKIDSIVKKILKSSEQAKDISESLKDTPLNDSVEFIKDYIVKRTDRITMLIETIINLAILADEIDIDDEKKTKELDERIEKELDKALTEIEKAKEEIKNGT